MFLQVKNDMKAHTRQRSKCWIHTPVFLPRLVSLRPYSWRTFSQVGWLQKVCPITLKPRSWFSSHMHTCALRSRKGGASEKQKCSHHAGNQESGVRRVRGMEDAAQVQLCLDVVWDPETSPPTSSGYRSLGNSVTLYETHFSHLESNIYLTEFYNDTRDRKVSHSPLHLLEVQSV